MSAQGRVDLPVSIKVKAHEALVSVWYTSTQLKRASRRLFAEHGSSEAQFNLLLILKNSDSPVTQKELSERLLVDKSNITGLIDRIERQGLILRNNVPGDRRSYHITLTDAGRERIDELKELYMDVVREVMANFSDCEQDALIELMRKLRLALVERDR